MYGLGWIFRHAFACRLSGLSTGLTTSVKTESPQRNLLSRALDGLSTPLNVLADTGPGVAARETKKQYGQGKYAAEYLSNLPHEKSPLSNNSIWSTLVQIVWKYDNWCCCRLAIKKSVDTQLAKSPCHLLINDPQ